mgnify:CR=1 FL=1
MSGEIVKEFLAVMKREQRRRKKRRKNPQNRGT